MDDNNTFAFQQLNSIINNADTGFYFILARPIMQQQIADRFYSHNIAVYNYAGQENKFNPGKIYHFLDENADKKIIFILNFQVPFFDKEVNTQQEDYLNLNLSRDILFNDYGDKLLFFFMTPETEKNIYLAAMDFAGYIHTKIAFNSIYFKPEIEERLARYQETIDEYLHIELANYNIHAEKDKNYLLIAARDLSYFAELYTKTGNYNQAEILLLKLVEIEKKVLGIQKIYLSL